MKITCHACNVKEDLFQHLNVPRCGLVSISDWLPFAFLCCMLLSSILCSLQQSAYNLASSWEFSTCLTRFWKIYVNQHCSYFSINKWKQKTKYKLRFLLHYVLWGLVSCIETMHLLFLYYHFYYYGSCIRCTCFIICHKINIIKIQLSLKDTIIDHLTTEIATISFNQSFLGKC